jgi:hypothetical protein
MEVLHILIVDFCEATEPCALEILCRPNPLTIIGEARCRVAARRCGPGARGLRNARVIFGAIPLTAGSERATGDDSSDEAPAMVSTSGTFASWHAFS